jgi:tetratricopeptide (TPR) repeat protein
MIIRSAKIAGPRRPGLLVLLGLAFLLALAAVPAAAAAPEGAASQNPITLLPLKARLALFKAQEKRDAGDYQGSAKILYDFLAKNPRDDNYLVRYYLALSYTQAGEPAKALDHYQACVAADSTFAPGWAKLAETAYNLGSFRIASSAFMRSYDLDLQKPPELLYYAAAAYYLGGEPAKAVPMLQDLVSGSHGRPRTEWFRTLLAACSGASEGDAGKEAASRMLDQYADDPDAWRIAFQFYASIKDYREAALALTIKGFLQPLSREDDRTLGDLYSAIGVPAQASVYYERSIGETAAPQDFERLASSYIASYDLASALETITRALQKEPTMRLYSLLGDLNLMERDFGGAYAAYEKCAAMDTVRGRTYLMMGYCAYELGRGEDAIMNLERAAKFPEQEKTALDLLNRIKLAKR